MNKFYILLTVIALVTSLSAFSQAEVEDNDFFGEATSISSVGTLTGFTDTDWQGDTWSLEFEPGEYKLNFDGDACTRVRVIEYVYWYNPVVDATDDTPGVDSDCTFELPYRGCFQIDNKEYLSDTISETFTVVADRHYVLFVNPHMCNELDYSITLSTITDISESENSLEDISIFPNPTSGLVTVNANKNTKIEVVDVTGHILMSKTTQKESTKIDVSQLPVGMYFIVAGNKTLKLFKQD
jgi:hypothetical protein